MTAPKRDYFDVSPIIDAYPDLFKDIDHVCYAFSHTDKKNDPYADLGKSNISKARYYRAYRVLIRPRYLAYLTDGRFGKMFRLLRLFPTKPL